MRWMNFLERDLRAIFLICSNYVRLSRVALESNLSLWVRVAVSYILCNVVLVKCDTEL